nr:hypothetical protein [Tanacetum cinerariifolium]
TFLEKPTESEGFEKIIDFLNANPIKYALTVNPTIYTSCIKQFWATTKIKTVNGEEQIQALVNKKKEQFPEENILFLRNTLLSGEDRLKLTELMELCTQLQSRVFALETTKVNQALEIGSLKRRVKNLEKKASKKTHKLKKLYKIGSSTRVESSEDTGLGNQEDASKQRRRIDDLDANEVVALVDETQGRNDQDMFDTSVLDDEEVVAKKEVSTVDPVPTTGEVVTTTGVEVNTASITSQISIDEITLAKALINIRTSKPKAKGIVMQEPSERPTPTPIDSSQQSSKAKEKGKANMIKPEKPLKRKDQMMVDKDEEEDNIALIESWDNTQAMMDANYELAARLQEEERGELKLVKGSEKATEGSKKATEGSSKRETGKLEQEDAKRQRIEEDNESAEIKRCLEIIPDDDDDVTIKATPLSSKSPTIVDYKIYKEGRKRFFKNISAYGNSQTYLTFEKMFKNFNREDLEVLWNIVKARFKKTKPLDDMDNLLFQTLKTMFEHHVEDNIWKYQQWTNKVLNWKLFDLCGVYCLTTQNMVYHLIVEKMYPFKRNILQ